MTDTQIIQALPPITGLNVPIGSVLPYGGDNKNPDWLAQQGWLYCDGSPYIIDAKNDYYNLYTVIGGSFGTSSSSGNNYFNVPDCRGLFIRGTDNGAGRDPDADTRTPLLPKGNTGDNVGSYQEDTFKNHTHPYLKGFNQDRNDWKSGGESSGSYTGYTNEDTGTAISGDKSAGDETHPKNVYLNFIIKYK